MKVLIVGGGIGGLSAALALQRDQHEVTLVEKAEAFAPLGAGIIIAPNAAQLLTWLGVDLETHGHRLPALEVVDATGALLQRFDTGALALRYGPTWSFARPALHESLLAAVRPPVQLKLGATLGDLDETSDGVRAVINAEPLHFDVVVGADGLRSGVRERLYGALPYRYSGTSCYRGVVDNAGFERALEAWGADARVGVVPLAGGQLYYYLVHTVPQRSPPLEFPAGFQRVFGGLQGGIERLFAAMKERPSLHHDLEELDAPAWGRKRVFLLGDAAHAMTPNQGQGAAMAIEDAVALATALRAGLDGALERYVELRHARVRKMQLDSRRLGQLAHLNGSFARGLRNQALRLVPRALGEVQYRGVVEPGLRLLALAKSP